MISTGLDDPRAPASAAEPIATAGQLALDRTRMALERTTMSWIRTSTSLITFGFAVYKFFQIEKPNPNAAGAWLGPREFAIASIAIGMGALALATMAHVRDMREIRAQYRMAHYRQNRPPRSLIGIVSSLVSVLGIVALLVVIFRR